MTENMDRELEVTGAVSEREAETSKKSDNSGNATKPEGNSKSDHLKLAAARKKLVEASQEVGQRVQTGSEKVRQIPAEVRERSEQLAQHERVQQAGQVIRSAPQTAEDLVLKSRNSRLSHDEKNTHKNPVQKMFSSSIGRYGIKPLIEAIPLPFTWYGPGDVITGMSALAGRDVLTGDKLDPVDRILYGIATAIPLVPSTVLVEPAKLVRKGIEETFFARKQGDVVGFKRSAEDAVSGLKDIKKAVTDNSKSN